MREPLPIGQITGGKPDPRCIYPLEGQRFEDLMAGRDAPSIARAVGISPEIVRAYRRGHHKPSPTTKAKLEEYFGDTLDTNTEKKAPQPFQTTITDRGDGTFAIMITGQISDLPGLIKNA